MNGSRKTRSQLCFTALVHQIYVYVNEYLLVKSTSFGPIVRDSNTIIVRSCKPPHSPALSLSSAQYVVYYSFYTQMRTIAFIRKIIFSLFTDCAAYWLWVLSERFVIHASLTKISNRIGYSISLSLIDMQKLLKKPRLKSHYRNDIRAVVTLLRWKYTGYYKNILKLQLTSCRKLQQTRDVANDDGVRQSLLQN